MSKTDPAAVAREALWLRGDQVSLAENAIEKVGEVVLILDRLRQQQILPGRVTSNTTVSIELEGIRNELERVQDRLHALILPAGDPFADPLA